MPNLATALLVAAFACVSLASCGGGPTREQVLRSEREYNLGVGLWQEHNFPGAFEHLLSAVELDPDNAEAYLLLGNLFMIHRHDTERAENYFREALRASEVASARAGLPADARNSLGVLFIHAHRLGEAIEVLRESATDLMNRAPAVAWTNLGWAYLEHGDYDQALEALSQALQLQPQLCMAWYRTGQVHVAREEWEQADAALSHVVDVEDDTCRQLQGAWRLRGEVRARVGHREEAIADLERCVELAPESSDGEACRRLLSR